jgi:hypothetical protein
MLNKQLRTADSEWSSGLGVGRGAKRPHPKTQILLRNTSHSLGCCECGDEPSGSSATELVTMSQV